MKKLKISKYFLFISIFTFIAIFCYVVQNSYNNLMKPIYQVKISNSLKPIDPHLDVSVIDQIAKRQYYAASISPPPATGSSPAQ